jgi:capsular polysaccharide transport system permease protein
MLEARTRAPALRAETPLEVDTAQRRPTLAALSSRRPRWRNAFALLVALSAFGAFATYTLFFAPDVYVTELRFAVRYADPPRGASAPTVLAAPVVATVTESNAVVQFLRSRDALVALESRVDLLRIFGAPEINWFSRLPADASPEQLLRHIARHVKPFFDATNGIVAIEVRAYRAEDSLRLAETLGQLSEELVNRMSLAARRGLLAVVDREVAAAEQRLSRARDEVRRFREANEVLDPRRTAEGVDELRARLETELAMQRAQLDQLRTFSLDGAPAVTQQRERIAALERQARDVQRRATGGERDTLIAALRGFDTVETEAMLALRSYEALLASLERTRSDANRQQLYLAEIVRPTLPRAAAYPHRFEQLLTGATLCVLGGLLLLLVMRVARDHVQ